jgi:hypothetical protein
MDNFNYKSMDWVDLPAPILSLPTATVENVTANIQQRAIVLE